MKTSKIFFGILFIALAIGLILDAVGVMPLIIGGIGEISVFKIILGLILIAMVFNLIFKLKIADIFFPLALLFMLFEGNIAYALKLQDDNIINNWLLLGCAALMSVGVAILSPKGRQSIIINLDKQGSKAKETNIGSSVNYIDCEAFESEFFENDLGSCVIHFENVEKYQGNGTLIIENNLGSTTIFVPREWCVSADIDNSLGSVSWPNKSEMNPDGKKLKIKGENSLGAITIKFAN